MNRIDVVAGYSLAIIAIENWSTGMISPLSKSYLDAVAEDLKEHQKELIDWLMNSKFDEKIAEAIKEQQNG